jgi:AraC-like DNA-binding protein
VLVTPGVVIDYGAVEGCWHEDFICWTGPVADHLYDAGVVQTGVVRMGRSRRLLPLIEQAEDPSDDAQIAANALLQKFLVDLYLENRPRAEGGSERAVAGLRMLLSQQVERWWTVGEMAKHCGMSVNHFRTLFERQTGMRPKAYLERLKMMRAGERLCSSDDAVGVVANTFGYRDPYHFSRTFKRVVGLSPQHYRKTHR